MCTESTERSRWWGLVVLTLPVVVTSMDITILHIATPTITRELTPTPSQTLWILDAYGFLLAGLLILMGNLGDRIGRRRLLLGGAVLFGTASALAAFAPTPEVLIAGRALMGVGGATLMPSTLSLIRTMFPDPAERTRAIGIWTASLSAGIALGPVVGGVLLESWRWGSVFLINVPVIVVLIATAPGLVPEYRSAAAPALDLVSAALSFLAILPVVWAIKAVAEDPQLDPPVLLSLIGGLLAGAVFLVRQRRVRTPLVDVRLFADPRFTGAILGAGLAMFSLVGVMLYNAQYLQLVQGLSPLVAGVAMLPVMGSVATTAVLASVLVGRLGHPVVFGAGALVAAIGMLALSRVSTEPGILLAVVAAAVIGAGIAPMMTLATDVVVASAPPARSGAASALSETASEFGAAVGIAVLGSIGTAIYRSRVLGGLPDALPTEATEAVGSSLGSALGAAERLPAAEAGDLSRLARSAFVDGLSASTVSAAAVLAVAAVVCPLLLRCGRTSPEPARAGAGTSR